MRTRAKALRKVMTDNACFRKLIGCWSAILVFSLTSTTIVRASTVQASETGYSYCQAGYRHDIYHYDPVPRKGSVVHNEIPKGAFSVAKFIETIPKYCAVQSVIVEGHAARNMPETDAFELSKAKTLEMRDKLVQLGIDPKIIQTVSYGYSHPYSRMNLDDRFDQNDSRVEVRIVLGQKYFKLTPVEP